jgi:hypothetical protein
MNKALRAFALLLPVILVFLAARCTRHGEVTVERGLGPAITAPLPPKPTDAQIEAVRARFLEIYRPIVRERVNLGLEIKLDDNSPQYFGGMTIEEGNIRILIGSEAHGEPGVTADSYMALLCHEVGHRLAGAPFSQGRGAPEWSSAEGQCDYFAASDCLKRVYAADPDTQANDYAGLPPEIHARCAAAGGDASAAKVCLRVVQSGVDFANSLYQIYLMYPGNPRQPDIATPEAAEGSVGMLYPSMQCRLDTYVAGALGEPRPACWYK